MRNITYIAIGICIVYIAIMLSDITDQLEIIERRMILTEEVIQQNTDFMNLNIRYMRMQNKNNVDGFWGVGGDAPQIVPDEIPVG